MKGSQKPKKLGKKPAQRDAQGAADRKARRRETRQPRARRLTRDATEPTGVAEQEAPGQVRLSEAVAEVTDPAA